MHALLILTVLCLLTIYVWLNCLSHTTGLLPDLATISILSSYSFLSHYTYLPSSLVLTFPCPYSPLFMTPLHRYNCMWLISYPFDSSPFASDSPLADTSACRFSAILCISFSFYDSILVYLYKYCSKRSKSLQTWSPLWIQDHKPLLSFAQSPLLSSSPSPLYKSILLVS